MDLVRWKSLTNWRFEYFIKVPNEGRRSFALARKMKREGLSAGLPDVLCLAPSEYYKGLAIEFKVGVNKQTPAQIAWQAKLEKIGWLYRVCYSLDEAVNVVNEYFIGEKNDGNR